MDFKEIEKKAKIHFSELEDKFKSTEEAEKGWYLFVQSYDFSEHDSEWMIPELWVTKDSNDKSKNGTMIYCFDLDGSDFYDIDNEISIIIDKINNKEKQDV